MGVFAEQSRLTSGLDENPPLILTATESHDATPPRVSAGLDFSIPGMDRYSRSEIFQAFPCDGVLDDGVFGVEFAVSSEETARQSGKTVQSRDRSPSPLCKPFAT